MSTSCEGSLSLSSLFEIHLQKESILCFSQRIFFQSSMRDLGTFILSVADVVVTSVGGTVLVGLCVLL